LILLQKLALRTSGSQTLSEALDTPVRFSQASPAAFALLQPLLTASILVSGLWLMTAGRASPERERLDWAATLAFVLFIGRGGARHGQGIAANELARAIRPGVRARQHGPPLEVVLNVLCQSRRGGVTPLRLMVHGFENDVVQVARKLASERTRPRRARFAQAYE
jgi:hypothetical protein